MKLMEYEGKQLFREAGIPVPDGVTVTDEGPVAKAAEDIGFPVVVKAQVLSGGRGKRGGIKVVNSAREAGDMASILFRDGLTGEAVKSVLIEQGVNIDREFYLAITVDTGIGAPVLMASDEGGVDIESLPEDKIAIKPVNIFLGLQAFDVRSAVKGWGLEEKQIKAIIARARELYTVFKQYDADLVEINPLGLTKEGAILALDSKVIINDNALYRQRDFQITRERFDNELEFKASEHNLSYVKLDGNIGLLCTGAGLTLATLDLINDNGGSSANFLESGGANYANTYHGLELVLSDPDVRVLFINTFGLVSRADVICRGLADAIKELKPAVPIVACIRGTGEEEARRIFLEELGIVPFHNMIDGVKEAIRLAR